VSAFFVDGDNDMVVANLARMPIDKVSVTARAREWTNTQHTRIQVEHS
jgi:hypothetical protein